MVPPPQVKVTIGNEPMGPSLSLQFTKSAKARSHHGSLGTSLRVMRLSQPSPPRNHVRHNDLVRCLRGSCQCPWCRRVTMSIQPPRKHPTPDSSNSLRRHGAKTWRDIASLRRLARADQRCTDPTKHSRDVFGSDRNKSISVSQHGREPTKLGWIGPSVVSSNHNPTNSTGNSPRSRITLRGTTKVANQGHSS